MVDTVQFSKLIPIKALTPEQCRELAEGSEWCEIPAGDFIFREGDENKHVVYVLSGPVEMTMDGTVQRMIIGGTNAATLPLEQGKTHRLSAQAKAPVKCVKVDAETLDVMLSWNPSSGYEVQEIGEVEEESDTDWMETLLRAKVFRRVPATNIQLVFMRMKTEHYKAGDAVVTQGEAGEHFFIIREGTCSVIRRTRKNPEGMLLATLGPGDNFGEEALISGGTRNASVVMKTEGVLISLSKSDFMELLNEPLLSWLSYMEARELAAKGAIWIDVRLPNEFQEGHISGSINIPLPLLRYKMEKLDSNLRYLVYCDTGRRAAIAAYLMGQFGFDALIMQEPLSKVPAAELVA